jgi:hypothetical protein
VLGTPFGRARDRAQIRRFGSLGIGLDSEGYAAGTYSVGFRGVSFPSGTYTLFLYAETYDGGATLSPNFGTIEVINVTEYRPPAADSDSQDSGANAAAIAVPIVIIVLGSSVAIVVWWYRRNKMFSDTEYTSVTESFLDVHVD